MRIRKDVFDMTIKQRGYRCPKCDGRMEVVSIPAGSGDVFKLYCSSGCRFVFAEYMALNNRYYVQVMEYGAGLADQIIVAEALMLRAF